jgi:methyl-accepting chemotaxis protein
MKRTAEAMVAIDQSMTKTASKIEILTDSLATEVNNTTSIISRI